MSLTEPHAETPQQRPRFLDIHVLHSVPFSNLNRDDLGQPKEAHYGGVRRVRVSSQCLKRTVRKRMEADQVCEAAVRTKRLPHEVATRLVHLAGWDPETASIAAVALMVTAGFKPDKGSEDRTDMIAFLPADGAATLANIAHRHSALFHTLFAGLSGAEDTNSVKGRLKLATALGTALPQAGARRKKDKGGLDERAAQLINSEQHHVDSARAMTAEVRQALGAVNPMIALMGRMYAKLPADNVDGAVQAAHAITTHAAVADGDYFTTVDDLSPAGETGAGFLDVADYASGVFYKYATVDLDALNANMGGPDVEQANLVAAFADRFARCMSEAKKRVTAPHTPPSLVLLAARADAPLSYANAFERPVTAAAEGGYLASSIRRLLDEDNEVSAEAAPASRWLYVSRTATDVAAGDADELGAGLTMLPLRDLADAVAAHLTEARAW